MFVAETLAGQCFCWIMEGTLRFGDQLGRRHPRHQAADALPRVQHQKLQFTVILYYILIDSFK